MSSRIGRMLSVQIFGESHGPAVGVTLDGLPAGLALDQDALNAFLQRRAARGSAIATARRESDLPRIVSGLKDGITTGQPLTALFDNADTHSADYGFLPDRPRPGHADYPAWVRSAGFDDLRGSGHHSGRLTLPYAFAGGVALQLLSREGVRVGAHVLSIASERDDALDLLCPDMDALSRCHAQPVPTLDPEAGSRMYAAIMEARAAAAWWNVPPWASPPDWARPSLRAWKPSWPPSCFPSPRSRASNSERVLARPPCAAASTTTPM